MFLGRVYKILIVLFGIFWVATVSVGASDEEDWTVVTIARDGSWGIATASPQSQAIAIAIRACKAMSNGQNDCGAEFTTIKRGWTLALRCGDYRVLAAANDLKDARRAAVNREIHLNHYL